jgi:hypothetical protein
VAVLLFLLRDFFENIELGFCEIKLGFCEIKEREDEIWF